MNRELTFAPSPTNVLDMDFELIINVYYFDGHQDYKIQYQIDGRASYIVIITNTIETIQQGLLKGMEITKSFKKETVNKNHFVFNLMGKNAPYYKKLLMVNKIREENIKVASEQGF
jgi:hypothetical protein